MTPNELVAAACPKIGALGSAFYFHPDTLAKGKELELDGFRWYFLGRGGVLGDVEAPVITAAFGYFAPALVDKMWTTARQKVEPRDAGHRYMACCSDLGRSKLAGLSGLEAYCAAADKVNAAVDPAGLSLYAGISAEPLAADVPARAMQLTAVLREFRGSAHLLAVLASGLTAQVAHFLRRPDDYKTFGYADDGPAVTDADRAKLAAAESLTDQLVLPAYSTLSSSEADALVAGLTTMESALAG